MRIGHENILRMLWAAEGWTQLEGRGLRRTGGNHRAAMTLVNEGLVQRAVGKLQKGVVYGMPEGGAIYYRINPAVREFVHVITPLHVAVASGSEEVIFKAVVQGLINAGIQPTGTAINDALGRELGKQRNLSGREGQWREEVFRDNGWVYDEASRPRWRAA
jgi:hypothetical protein